MSAPTPSADAIKQEILALMRRQPPDTALPFDAIFRHLNGTILKGVPMSRWTVSDLLHQCPLLEVCGGYTLRRAAPDAGR